VQKVIDKRPTKTKTRNKAETLADELNKVPAAPFVEANTPNAESTDTVTQIVDDDAFGVSPERKRILEYHEKLRNDVPDGVKRLFERWEEEEFVPQDFETEVATNSLESGVGYTSLHRHLHRAFVKQVAYYRSEAGGSLDIEEARAAAFRTCTDTEEAVKELNTLLSLPVDMLGFIDLLTLHDYSPRTAERFWERTKLNGRREFESGHLAAHISFPVDYKKTLWNIAKYLGVRESFIDEWRPKGGIEIGLIDVLVQTYFQFQYWLEQTVIRSQTPERSESHAYMKWRAEQQEYYKNQGGWDEGDWFRPYVTEVEAVEHAVQMADRFHRMYVRTLKQMRDHRRYSLVMINNVGQVNIATEGGKQVNVKGD
jgi:hypothetical protein